VVLGTLAAVLANCGTTDGNVGPTCDNPDEGHIALDGTSDPCHDKDIDLFCDATTPRACEALVTCCDGRPPYGSTTIDECTQGLRDECHGAFGLPIAALIRAGATVLDQDRLQACVSRLQSILAGGRACVEPPLFYYYHVCLGAFRGQIAAGEPCDWPPDLQDVGDFIPCKDGVCQDGKCVPFIKTGEACPTQVPGTPYYADQLCNYVAGEWCRGTPDTGTCGPRGEVGDACNPVGYQLYECKSFICSADSECLPSTQTIGFSTQYAACLL